IEGVPQGKGLDQWQSAPIEGFDTRIIGANDYGPAAGSEVVVVTAGIARKPGMSRDDLVRTNADIVQQVARQIKQHCPTAIVVVVSNPLDVMCWVTKTVTGFPRERVIGMAGVPDTARNRARQEARPPLRGVAPGGVRVVRDVLRRAVQAGAAWLGADHRGEALPGGAGRPQAVRRGREGDDGRRQPSWLMAALM